MQDKKYEKQYRKNKRIIRSLNSNIPSFRKTGLLKLLIVLIVHIGFEIFSIIHYNNHHSSIILGVMIWLPISLAFSANSILAIWIFAKTFLDERKSKKIKKYWLIISSTLLTVGFMKRIRVKQLEEWISQGEISFPKINDNLNIKDRRV